MSPLDEAPEQRWRRTVDRRSRPAKLKVDRLLRDFGYSDLDAQVGDAIEARLAGVALAVSPPLRDAAVGQVVTIYADERPIEERTPPPAPDAREREPEPEPEAAPKPRPRPRPNVAPPPPEPAVVTDIAQMVTYLKQEVLDARAESERLRTELDQRIASRTDAATEAQAIIAEQAATLEEQSRQIAELGAALDHTREALAETREEIRRAVGELQALPEPELFPEAVTPDDEADPADDMELAAVAPYADPDVGVDAADVAWPVEDPGHVVQPPPAGAADAPAIADAGLVVEEPALGVDAAATELEDPALPAAEMPSEHEEPASGFDDPLLDPDEPPLGAAAGADEPELPDDTAAAGEPVAADAPGFAGEPGFADEPGFAGEPGFAVEPAFAPEPALAPEAPAREERDEPESWVPAQLRERDPEPVPDAGARADFAGADAPPPETPERAAEAREQTAEARARAADLDADDGEPPIGDDALTDFDEFLYDPDELYDPESRAAGDDPSARTEHDAAWLDEPAGALPPPPPPPPSPWAEAPEAELEAPLTRDRPTRGKALRGRGGRGRGRWQGSCSICGRLPVENKRKDLEAAGWDLDDDAAACPQCRGIG